MLEIGMSNIHKNFGYNKKLLDGFNFEVLSKERVSLIGQNGSGKTTIFKIITGEESIQDGILSIRKDSTVGLLSQIPPKVSDEVTVRDILNKPFENIFDIEKHIRKLEEEMVVESNNKNKLKSIMNSYSKLQQNYEIMGGYDVPVKINKIMDGFKIKYDKLDRIYNTLSGGEKTIVNLASLMISEPSILLLDEPTNHLDIDTLEWFEGYLKNYKGTIVISSHDRYFLDQVTTKTVLIERGQSEIFNGNYSYYLEENEKRILREFEEYKNQEKLIEAMKKKILKLQEFGRLAYPEGGNFFKRAASIQKRLDKIELLDKRNEIKDLPLDFKVNKRSGKDVLVINSLTLNIENKCLLKDVDITLAYQDKICLMGANGCGKSTLIKAILEANQTQHKNIKIGSNVIIGYIPQEITFDNDQEQILEYTRKCFVGEETKLRASLNKFMFYGDDVFKRVGSLSGGEKVRLKLFELIQKEANLLILDEPTNHIDISTKEVLEEALKDYKGTLLFISHDRYFINKLATKILYISNQNIQEYMGNYNYYKDKKNSKNVIINTKPSNNTKKKTNKKKKK